MRLPPPDNLVIRDLTRALVRILHNQGVDAVSMRRLAEEDRSSVGALYNHVRSRRQLLSLCGQQLARHREGDISGRLTDGIVALLPHDEEMLPWERAWLAWRTWALTDDGLRRLVAETEFRERHLLLRALAPEVKADPRHHLVALRRGDVPPGLPSEAELDLLWTVVLGLRARLCLEGLEPLDLDQARRQLRAASALARRSLTIASGSAAE